MKLITPPLVIGDSDCFTNDIFERKSFGDSLLGLIKHSDDGLVISLDSQWGEGKTTFIKMWQGVLKEEKIANIYIDAFQNDYNNDAFITYRGVKHHKRRCCNRYKRCCGKND